MSFERAAGALPAAHARQRSGWPSPRSRARLVTGMVACAVLSGCGGAGGGGQYGEAPTRAPMAVASVLGTGAGPGRDATVKSGTEVTLSAKDSEGVDSPILQFAWVQTDTTPFRVAFSERSRTAVNFVAPRVTARTTLSFRLDVADGEGDRASDAVDVVVEPIGDADRFLTYFGSDPDRFALVAALARGTRVLADATLAIEARRSVTYADRLSVDGQPNRTVALDAAPVTLTSRYRAGTVADWNSVAESIDAFYSPRFNVAIPDFDVDEINRRFETVNRDARLDPEHVAAARLLVDYRLVVSGGTCQDQAGSPIACADAAVLYLLRRDGSRVSQGSDPRAYQVAAADLYAMTPTQPGQTAPENATTAAAYYRAVDPFGRRTKLSDWMALAGFTVNGALIPADRYAHATYVNNYDLGFGRDMFLRRDEATGSVYTFVTNYPSLEAAMKRVDAFATVVMEFSPPDQDPNGAKFVKFFAFVPDDSGDQVRTPTFNFDGRGEKVIPGVCTACHGGRPTFLASGEYANFGNVNASFLPWDLDALLYARAADPDQVDPDLNTDDFTEAELQAFSRQAQEAQFRQLNMGAAATYGDAARFATARELVHGWYGDTTQPFDTFPNATFDGNYVPAGWAAEAAVYRDAFAPFCRSCHANNDSVTFATFDDFARAAPMVKKLVFEDGLMPLARLTHDRFWVDFDGRTAGAEALRARLAGLGEDVAGSNPGPPRARISGAPEIAMNRAQVRLDGAQSAGATAFAWQFLARPTGSAATLVGDDTNAPGFRIDVPGLYTVQLRASNAFGDSTTSVSIRADSVAPAQAVPPAGVTPTVTVGEGSAVTIGAAALTFSDVDNTADEVVFTVSAAPVSGALRVSGTPATTFTQADIAAGRVDYVHDGSDSTQDSLTFEVTDGTTTLRGQRLQVIVLPVDDAPSLLRNLRLSVPEDGSTALDASVLAVADSDTSPAQVLYTVTQAPAEGVLSALSFSQADLDQNGVAYTHAGGETPSDLFRFTVTDGGTTIGPFAFGVDIIAVADSPTRIAGGPLDDAIRGRDTTITMGDLRHDDADTPASAIVYTVTSPPAGGVLTDGNSVLASFTQADIDAGRVRYRDQGDVNDLSTATATSFAYSVSDGTTTLPGNTFAITVNPAPDAPMRGTSDLTLQAFGASVGSALAGSDLGYTTTAAADITYAVVTAPASGTLRVDGVPATSWTQADVNLGRVTYLPADAAVTADAFTFRVSATVAPGVTITVPAPAQPAETFNVTVRASFARDVAPIFRTRHDANRRACIECHCRSGSPDCTINPSVAEAIDPVTDPSRPDWSLDPTLPTGLLQELLLHVSPADPDNSLVLLRPQGILHSGNERPGFDLDDSDGGDRSRYDLLRRYILEGCAGLDNVATGCLP
jgi:hypothetical protein